MKDMALILDLVRAFVEAVPEGNGEEARGVQWFDSYRGAFCPTCYPDWPEGATGYQHDPECPFLALLKEVAA